MLRDFLKLLAAALFLSLVAAISLAGGVHAAQPGDSPQPVSLAYGTAPLQRLDFWPAIKANPGPAPLILFVHGGAWQHGNKDNATGKLKDGYFTQLGYAFASIDYRLVPDVRVEDQAQDVADAAAYLVHRSRELGLDPHRVVLMGHSAGAHLVALVGTDPRYLAKAGLTLDDIRGIVAIDGAAYSIPEQMHDAGWFMRRTYETAFGTSPERQQALSPVHHAPRPNVQNFLILHVQRTDGIRQAKLLEDALKASGTHVERQEFPGDGLRGHVEINRRLGDPDYAPTTAVRDWLARTFQ